VVKKTQNQNQSENGNVESEQIDYDNLLKVWKEYSLKVKSENKNSLHSTLSNSKPKISSDLVISFDISNSIAAKEFDKNINEFTAFLKTKLKNSKITLSYSIVESEVVKFSDSKTKYESLLKENSSLEKFRKLFNLDIEY